MSFSKETISGFEGSTYDTLDAKMGDKRVLKIDRTTTLHRGDERFDTIVVCYHDTAVLTYYVGGDVMLNDGGYMTMSTRTVMNSFLTPQFRVSTGNGYWSVSHRNVTRRYATGIVLNTTKETISFMVDAKEQDAENKAILKRIRAYAALYTPEVVYTLLETHDASGDCWECVGMLGDNEKLGSVHLEMHMEESYVLFSLLMNAYRDIMQASNTERAYTMCALRNSYGRKHSPDSSRDAQQIITRYLKKHLFVGSFVAR